MVTDHRSLLQRRVGGGGAVGGGGGGGGDDVIPTKHGLCEAGGGWAGSEGEGADNWR